MADNARRRKQPRVHELDPASTDMPEEFKAMGDFDEVFSLSFRPTFCLIAIVRVLSAYFNIMSDCDEVFNYWEPTHLMLHGFGLQTWEYSPEFALRSYAYSGLHAILGIIAGAFSSTKVTTFFHMRVMVGLFSALCEAYFVRAVKLRFGGTVCNLTLLFLMTSPGMFLASTAYLPNTFAMHCLLVGYGCWLLPSHSVHNNQRVAVCVGAVSCAVLMGTPFVIVAAVPVALQLLVQCGPVRAVFWGVVFAVLWLGGSCVVDYVYYGFVTCPIFNTLMYNALGSGPGSQLYGVEPASFYAKNLLLNFNLQAVAAVLTVPILLVCSLNRRFVSWNALRSACVPAAMYVSPLYVWLAVMLKLEHKEERFLFAVYPVICVAAAITFSIAFSFASNIVRNIKWLSSVVGFAQVLVLIFIVLAGVSRIVSMHINYHAPYDIWQHVSEIPQVSSSHVSVCVSKEWFRFPSSFFTPDHVRIQYVKSDFKGQLPRYFLEFPNATQITPVYFNDLNIGDPAAFVDEGECDYFVDFEPSYQREPRLSEQRNWKVIHSIPFLESETSHPLFRALYVPILGKKYVKYAPYYLLKRR